MSIDHHNAYRQVSEDLNKLLIKAREDNSWDELQDDIDKMLSIVESLYEDAAKLREELEEIEETK